MSWFHLLFFALVSTTVCFANVTEGMVKSADGSSIAYGTEGQGATALVFVHGWTGSSRWWDEQFKHFSDRYQVVGIDLAGHGKSDKNRVSWTAMAYAEDIRAVCDALGLQKIVLVGHSMSGTNTLAAYHLLSRKIVALVPVDTLHDLDHVAPTEETDAFFKALKEDWKLAMEKFGDYVFNVKTPPELKAKLQKEMSEVDPKIAIPALETVYRTDIRPLTANVTVPVRAIQGGLVPTNEEANHKYFADYGYQRLEGYGHFPMMENPALFNNALEQVLITLP